MEKIKFGIIGAGSISARIAETFRLGLVTSGELIAVAARDKNKAKEFSNKHNIPKSYGSYEELLNNAEINCVYIGTVNSTHYEICINAINAGKHVLCEKPMVMTKSEAKEIYKLSQSKKVFIMEAMWTRFLPTIIKAKEWVSKNMIGEVLCFESALCYPSKEDPSSRLYNKSLGGGALYDLGVYCLSISQFFAPIDSDITDVNSIVINNKTEVDTDTYIHLKYENNFVSEIKTSLNYLGNNATILYGREGKIIFHSPIFNPEKVSLHTNNDGEVVEEFFIQSKSGFEYEINHVCDCINSGLLESPVHSMKDVIEISKIYDIVLK